MGREETPSKYVFWGINLVEFDLSTPRGLLPLAVTYYGGNLQTRRKYISMISLCFGENLKQPEPEVSVEKTQSNKALRSSQIQIEQLKQDFKAKEEVYVAVALKKRRESNPEVEHNLQLQLDSIAKKMDEIQLQLQDLGYEFE